MGSGLEVIHQQEENKARMLPGPGNYKTDGINTTNKYSFGKS